MKNLGKKSNLSKKTLEAYNMYSDCNCECRSYCKKDNSANYKSYKSLQGNVLRFN